MASKDRRKHPRLSVSLEVDVSSGHNFYAGRTRDISAGGLFIEGDLGLSPGAELTVRLHLSDHRLTLRSEVMWVLAGEDERTVGVGVRFVELGADARAAIDAFMATRSPLAFEAEEPEPGKGPPPLPR
jgi:uncharacterized protein (TIGR02266 family)